LTPQGEQFIVFDVFSFVLGKAQEEYRPILHAVANDHAIPAGSSASWAGNALLNEAPAQIGVY
jgi:hypothetical protein